MGEANGLNFVLDAAAELKRRGDSQVQFLLIGDGKERPNLEERVDRESLPNVTFSAPLPKEQIVQVFEASDVCMTIFKNVPILRTCSPNKLFDSLAAGRPVLTNMPGWLGDIAVDDKTGVLVEPDNPIAFADRVTWMVEHPDELAEFSKNARALAQARFERGALAHKLEAVLSSAVDQHQ
jgi:glycosyltransferase involved in cell wall biosynthesis